MMHFHPKVGVFQDTHMKEFLKCQDEFRVVLLLLSFVPIELMLPVLWWVHGVSQGPAAHPVSEVRGNAVGNPWCWECSQLFIVIMNGWGGECSLPWCDGSTGPKYTGGWGCLKGTIFPLGKCAFHTMTLGCSLVLPFVWQAWLFTTPHWVSTISCFFDKVFAAHLLKVWLKFRYQLSNRQPFKIHILCMYDVCTSIYVSPFSIVGAYCYVHFHTTCSFIRVIIIFVSAGIISAIMFRLKCTIRLRLKSNSLSNMLLWFCSSILMHGLSTEV